MAADLINRLREVHEELRHEPGGHGHRADVVLEAINALSPSDPITVDRALEFAENALHDARHPGGARKRDAEAALPVIGKLRDDLRGALALTAEEVQVVFGVLEELRLERQTHTIRDQPLRGLTGRERELHERMRVMLGCTADGERR